MVRFARARRAPRPAGGLALAARVVLGVVCLGAALLTAGIPSAVADQGSTFVLGDLRIAPPTGYVNDQAGLLTAAQQSELEQLCRGIDQRTGAQIALAILPSLKGETADDVKVRLFEAWGVGHKADDRGLLILHALEERRIEIEVGYGLEGVLPDARVGRILDEHVVPNFRTEKFFEGYRAGLTAIGQVVAGDPDAQGGTDAYGRGTGQGGGDRFPFVLLILIPILLYLFVRHPRLLVMLMLMNMGGGGSGGGRGSRGGFGGGFGGFGGGRSGGGGAGRSY